MLKAPDPNYQKLSSMWCCWSLSSPHLATLYVDDLQPSWSILFKFYWWLIRPGTYRKIWNWLWSFWNLLVPILKLKRLRWIYNKTFKLIILFINLNWEGFEFLQLHLKKAFALRDGCSSDPFIFLRLPFIWSWQYLLASTFR